MIWYGRIWGDVYDMIRYEVMLYDMIRYELMLSDTIW